MSRPITALAIVALLIGSTAACSSDDGDDPAPAASATTTEAGSGGGTEPGTEVNTSAYVEAPTGTLAEVDCWWPTDELDPEVEITCSTLTVPVDWNDPDDTGEVVLPVYRLHHRDVSEDVAPIVNLHGGPGGDALGGAPVNASGDSVVRQADVIYYDQRGAGRSEPNLNCPEKERATVAALASADSVEDELAAGLAAVEECRERLVGSGIDLDHFNTIQSVNDLDALRDAMGYETWNVRGGSYGTRLGLAYARVHPERVRALAIDSVYPPEAGGLERFRDGAEGAIDRLVAACAEDEACHAAIPDLDAELEAAAADLDQNPNPITATVTVDGEEETREFVIGGADLRSGMFAAQYQQALIPLLPGVIAAVADGDRGIIPTYVESAVPILTGLSEGAFYSVECADTGRFVAGTGPEDFIGDGRYATYAMNLAHTWCSVWDVAPVDAAFNEPVLADVPTLVFGGTLDPVTPYSDSAAQAEAMPDARLVTVPRGGHGVARWNDCTTEALLGFLEDPAAELPACVEDIEATPFAIGGGS